MKVWLVFFFSFIVNLFWFVDYVFEYDVKDLLVGFVLLLCVERGVKREIFEIVFLVLVLLISSLGFIKEF